ncbi:MAG: hemin import ATP-binding protein HmuV [Phycisphaerales bacterium]|nr:MAG: hemin import ATP-binding protein HmuV [Phycisphaerales bacterium]
MPSTRAHDPADAVLRTHHLAHRFAGQGHAIGPIELALRPGAILAVVGPNGAGKSTLLRLLAGVLTPTAGRVELLGRPIARWPARLRAEHLALAPQRTSLAFAYTVAEYVGFGAWASGRRPASGPVDAALHTMDLTHLADRPMPQLSVGQQQRAALARALAQLGAPPLTGKVLLADEPASALDTRHAALLAGTLRDLADKGLAIVVVAHDLPWAAAVADQALAIDADGSATPLPGQALRDPATMRDLFDAPFQPYRNPAGLTLALPAYGQRTAPQDQRP